MSAQPAAIANTIKTFAFPILRTFQLPTDSENISTVSAAYCKYFYLGLQQVHTDKSAESEGPSDNGPKIQRSCLLLLIS